MKVKYYNGYPGEAIADAYVDMDGVFADFAHNCRRSGLEPMEFKMLPGAYRDLPPIPGALEGLRALMALPFNVWVCTKIPTRNVLAATEKLQWIEEHIPELIKRIIITHDKSLVGRPQDFLIDDRPHKANCESFRGTLIHFGPGGTIEDWDGLVAYFEAEAGRRQAKAS